MYRVSLKDSDFFQCLGESWGGASAGAGKGGFDSDSASAETSLAK